ncbi:MAG TPA: signal peptidase I [Polyangia bacterium]
MGTVRAHVGGLGDLGAAESRRQDAALARAAAAQRREATSADDLRAHTPPAGIAAESQREAGAEPELEAAARTEAVTIDAPAATSPIADTAAGEHRLLRPLAALLSVAVPGLGQLAVGHPVRGLRWYLAAIVGWTTALIAAGQASPRLMWLSAGLALVVHVVAAVDGFRIARRPRPLGPTWLDTGAALFAGFLLAAVPVAGLAQARARYLTTLPVQTPSMYPTLEVGDHVLVNKGTSGIERGDLLVFHYPKNPSTQYVKRVIGVGGDVVEIRGDDVVLNGQALPRTAHDQTCRAEGPEGAAACSMWHETLEGRSYRVAERAPDKTHVKVEVPPGHYFVLGDNRDGSNDSRLFGTVPGRQVIGRASFVWWSAHAAGVRWQRINQRIPE